ncbi:MAG: ribose 5-phosphate isomerase B [Deltaproteobacteria bacterium]|nr:ribose 5-phosphate isomerase B [Deltaproteobacteria bacterium]
MRIAIGSDHRGVDLKAGLVGFLKKRDIVVLDKGPDSKQSCDYPDYAGAVCKSVQAGETDLGIVICGSGIGVSITANKFNGIRCALAYCTEVAGFARRHNNANVLALGADFVSLEHAKARVSAWLDAEFEGGRHQRRIDKITALEKSS